MTPGELGSGRAETASRQATHVTSPRVLILAAAALVLTNVPLTRYGSGGHQDYFWSSLGVLLAVWQLWDHRRLAWAALTAATTVTLLLYGLSLAGVLNTGLPGWWIPITGAADILALAILLSPPIRRWVTKQPAPALRLASSRHMDDADSLDYAHWNPPCHAPSGTGIRQLPVARSSAAASSRISARSAAKRPIRRWGRAPRRLSRPGFL